MSHRLQRRVTLSLQDLAHDPRQAARSIQRQRVQ